MIAMFMSLLFFIIVGSVTFQFIQLLIMMKQEIILPTTNEELLAIRKYPLKTVDFPSYSKQRVGIIVYSVLLLVVVVLFFLGVFIFDFDWSLYLLMFLPLANSQNLLNLFAVVEDGLLIGRRFIVWKKIKSFQFIPIDPNHPFYGYSKEVNGGYELKISTKLFSTNCIVTSDEMKERLDRILTNHVMLTGEK